MTHHIAVVGMAARFPGAPDLDRYWRNLRDGVESVRFPTDDELRDHGVSEEMLRHPDYVKAFANAPGIQEFDSALFGYIPRDADHTDPQIRLFLECAHAALEHAGYGGNDEDATVAVYGSAGANRYLDQHLNFTGDASASTSFALTALNNTDYAAITAAYKLDLRGAAITVSTACSSSLVAAHLAGQALRNGECDIALAGGAEVEMPFGHGYLWAEGSPFTRDGHVRAFDVKADGTLFSSGAGVVVLKRLDDALADGDTIHSVLRGSAVNNDGSAKAGFTAPSIQGQSGMLAEAFAMAEVTARDLSFVECHATGTALGDPMEVAALHRALRAVGPVDGAAITLGSVKSNIGHLGHASGMASLIKSVIALRQGELPATVNFTEPNPKLELDNRPFVIADRLRELGRAPGTPKVGGVSSFGVGGTNAHVVVEEPPAPTRRAEAERPRIVIWSARSDEAVDTYRERLADHFAEPRHADTFGAAVNVLQRGRRAHARRSALIASNASEAADALRSRQRVIAADGDRRDVVFAFPGQGSQQAGMALALYDTDPAFATAMDEALEHCAASGVDVRETWRAGAAEWVLDTVPAQTLIFSVEYALARALSAQGIHLAAVIGHSVGELAGAVVAGVLSLADGAALVAARARAMAQAPEGAMLAVAASAAELEQWLPDGVTLAVANGSRQCVLSGSRAHIDAARAELSARKLACTMLNNAGAFHSPLMRPAVERFALAFDDVALDAPQVPFYSAAAGGMIGAEQAVDPYFWAEQLAAPVRYDRALAALLDDGRRLVLEVGPGKVLTQLGKASAAPDAEFVPVLPDADAGHDALLTAVAHAWVHGHDVSWPEMEAAGALRRVPLPGYPYQRRKHWVEPPEKRPEEHASVSGGAQPDAQAASAGSGPVAAAHAEGQDAGDGAATPLSQIDWVLAERPPASPLDGTVLLLLPPKTEPGMPLVLAALQAGAGVVIARPGTAYAKTGGEFRVRPGERADYERLIAELAERGTPLALVVHGLTLDGPREVAPATLDAAVERSFSSLYAVAQAVGSFLGATAPGLLVVSSSAVDVTGAEAVDPTAAMLSGFARSLAAEAPRLGCRVIDVSASGESELSAELGQWRTHEVVALRGARRWTARRTAFHAGEPVPALRRQGVYLITGGTGGLGMALARGIAGTGRQPRLVVLSRRGLAEDATDERSVRLRAEVAALTALGAQVRVLAADVADPRAVRRALDTAAARFGPLNGVFHLAGVPGDGLVLTRGAQQAARVLEPKVRGTVLLAEELREAAALDFFACFSSRAAVDGLVGSADYAAANAFQDALTLVLRRSGTPAVSINWPSWAGVGMAAEYGVRTWSCEISPEQSPIMDEHRLQGKAVLPGTGQLDVMLRAHRELTGQSLPVRFTDVVYHQVLATEQRRLLEVRLHPDGVVESWSRSLSEPAAEPVLHASAKVAAAGAPLDPVSVETLRGALTHPLAEKAEGPRLFHLGPRWDNIAGTWARSAADTDELLLALRLPEEFLGDLDAHLVHPTLLDSATTSFRREDDGFHLPFCCETIAFHDSLPAELFAHVRRRPGGTGVIRADLDLLAPDGRVLCRASGYTLRRVEESAAVTGGPGVGPPDAAGAGIDPLRGVELTLEILGSAHAGQVLVEPEARPFTGPPRNARAAAAAPTAGPETPTASGTPHVAPYGADAHPRGEPAGGAAEPGSGPAALAQRVKALWVEAIGDPQISEDTDFFEIGGSSLTAIALIGSIREEFRVDLSVGAIFDYPTIGSLSTLLWERGAR